MARKKSKTKADTLERIEELVRVIAKSVLAGNLAAALKDKNYRTLYEGTGRFTRPELEKKTGFSGGKISGIWKEWEQLGFVVKEGKSYRKML